MNRSVLARQMFAKGGAAFPDLNKDGEITQADILMGRGVEFKQEGGIAGMMPMDAPAAMPQEEGQALDPQVLSTVLGAASEQVGDLDNAEDYEEVMNSIRGDDATIEQRYAELAGVVGEEDARATPESVLTLVQPAMVMAASVDQGIGELAQEEMSAPVEGAMAQGIMSTVAPPEPQPMPMEGAPPVNFKDGGLVRRGDNQPVQYYAKAGEVALPGTLRSGQAGVLEAIRMAEATAAGAPIIPKRGDGTRLRELVEGQRELYREYGLGDPESRAADLEEQKNLTQSQMLFDIANTALTFAGGIPGERPGMSAAERLAAAAVATKLPQTIGARAQAQREFERDLKKEGRTMDLAALQSAETKLAAEVAQEDALALAKAKKKDKDRKPMVLLDKTGTKVLGQYDINNDADYAAAKKMRDENPGSRLSTGGPEKPNTVTIKGQVIDITDMANPKVVFGDKDVKTTTVKGQVIDITDPKKPTVIFGDKSRDITEVKGQLIDHTDPKNVTVIFGDKDVKTTTVNGEVIDITNPKNPTVIYGEPDRKTLTVDGEVIDITDPNDVKVIYGDKKRDIRVVKGQLVEIKDDKATPIFGKRTPDKGTFENMILADGKNILVKKVGETLFDVNGDPIDLSTETYEGAVIVSKDKAFETSRLASSQAAAADKLRVLNQEIGDSTLVNQISSSDNILGVSGGRNTARRTFDALSAARKGLGFYSKFKQAFSEVGGALVPALRNVAADEVEAGNFIDAVNVLGRVALANSPRFAEAEQQRLANLFPSTDFFLTNPENAVRKLAGLKRLMQQEYKNNLDALSRSQNASIRQQAEQQNYAIEGVLTMLETIPVTFVSDTQFDDTISELEAMRNQRTGTVE